MSHVSEKDFIQEWYFWFSHACIYPGVTLLRTETLHLEKVTYLSVSTPEKFQFRKKFHVIVWKNFSNNSLLKILTTENFEQLVSPLGELYSHVTSKTEINVILPKHKYILTASFYTHPEIEEGETWHHWSPQQQKKSWFGWKAWGSY